MRDLKLTQQEIAGYRAAIQRQARQEQQALARREQRAWKLARRAAELLREKFGATRVVLFGSLLQPGCFTPWSDVDIAAWGLRSQDTFRAMGAVMDLDTDIEVNLVDVQTCSASLLVAIECEGVEL